MKFLQQPNFIKTKRWAPSSFCFVNCYIFIISVSKVILWSLQVYRFIQKMVYCKPTSSLCTFFPRFSKLTSSYWCTLMTLLILCQIPLSQYHNVNIYPIYLKFKFCFIILHKPIPPPSNKCYIINYLFILSNSFSLKTIFSSVSAEAKEYSTVCLVFFLFQPVNTGSVQ